MNINLMERNIKLDINVDKIIEVNILLVCLINLNIFSPAEFFQQRFTIAWVNSIIKVTGIPINEHTPIDISRATIKGSLPDGVAGIEIT